jgi:hypothetical protein
VIPITASPGISEDTVSQDSEPKKEFLMAKKTEELGEKDLDAVQGGMLLPAVQAARASSSDSGSQNADALAASDDAAEGEKTATRNNLKQMGLGV